MWLLYLLFLLAIFHLFLKKNTTKLQHPPGPKGLPLIGNLHQFDVAKPHIYLSNLSKIYGPILFLKLGSLPMVVIQSSKLAKEVLKTQDHNFCSRPNMVGQQKLTYGLDIVLAPYNAYFREMRKISVVHLFSSKRVQSFAHIRRDEVLRMINKISSLASTSNVVNLTNLALSLTNSITCRIAFGRRYEDEGMERSKFHCLLNEVQDLLSAFFFSDYLPWIGWLDKFTGISSKLERVFSEFDKFYDDIINEHLDENDRPTSHREDIVDVLLQLRKQRSFAFDLTYDHIKAVLVDIFVAGTDTSAAMIIWAMTELMKNKHIMKKVQDELRRTFQNKKFIEEEDLTNLKYIKAVVKETFRLHPAAPLLVAHQSLRQCSIEGYDILPNTIVFVNAWAIGRDPEIWEDPETFMPERFLESSIDFKGNDFELIPFGAGRRICPGLLLGVANFELALANLLFSFEWEFPVGKEKEAIDTDVLPGITMHKKLPLCLMPKKFHSN